MIVDLSVETPPLSEMAFDVCVAGAGVAGTAIAIKLADAGWRVALCEAGGVEPSATSQDFYRGDNTGTENLLLHETRIRAFGGSSNHWGGWCRPLDAHDFERNGYSPDGTWPIGAADLAPYLREAAAFLDVSSASGADLPLNGAEGNLRTIRMFFSAPPLAVGRRYAEDMKRLGKLHLFLNAAVSTVVADAASGELSSLGIRKPGSAELLACRAKLFVLAMGSVENARRLLIWNRAHGDNIGNRHGLVGRYYLQHLHQKAGQFVRFSSAGEPGATTVGDRTFFAGTRDFIERVGIGAFRLYSSGIACSALADQLTGAVGAARCVDVSSGADLFITAEHHPDPESRIRLASTGDDFGDPRPWLDFRIGEADARTLREASVEFGRFLIRSEVGRLKVHPNILSGENPVAGWTALPSAPGAAGHQMGGTRMSASAADGVVDRDCKVWGTENLYVVGAAVFRSCGHTTPTLTITQLALRLADRLHRVLSSM